MRLTGIVLRAGRPLDLATAPLHLRATRCREPGASTIQVWVEATPRVDPVLTIAIDPARAETGATLPIADRQGAAGVAAWLSPTGRAATHTPPTVAWVRLDAIAPEGGPSLSFEADFGPLGRAAGELRVDTVEWIVCRPPPARR